jgi:large conductance mechanosensitive channel
MKGDVLSLTTAVVIGGFFGKIVGSAVDDVICQSSVTYWWDWFHKRFVLDGNSYADLAAKRLVLR